MYKAINSEFIDSSDIKNYQSQREINDNYIRIKKEFVKSKVEKQLVRKINYTLLPFVWACTFLQFIDKTVISISAVLGMIDDTGITGSQYSWLGSLFYLGYILFQLPNNYLIQKFPISKYLGSLLFIWGIVMGCTALCNNFTQLAIARILLGFFEAGTYPCLLIVLNAVYRRSEQSAAYGFLLFSNGSGIIIGAACSYGISFINNAYGIDTWRWPYIIFGTLTCFVGILVFFFLPDTPTSFMFKLTEEERKIVEKRTRDNAVVRVKEFKTPQIWEALQEPRLWLIGLSTFCNNLPAGSLIVFGTIIVKNLGFSSRGAILLQMVTGFFGALFCFFGVYVARKSGQAYIGVVVSSTISLLGLILLAVLPNTGIKFLGYILAWGLNGTSVILLSIVAENVTGYTKKIFYNGFNLTFSTLGSFIGPLLMFQTEAPVYKTGMIVFSVANVALLVMLLIVRQLMSRQNKIRFANYLYEEFDVYEDLTDKQNKSFIYKL